MAVTADLPDTAIKVYANDWVATIFASPWPDPSGFYSICAITVGSSAINAEFAANYVLAHFANGRLAVIRVRPQANSEKDFATQITHHRGIVRFSYKLEPGSWHWIDEDKIQIPSIGDAVDAR